MLPYQLVHEKELANKFLAISILQLEEIFTTKDVDDQKKFYFESQQHIT